MGPPIAQSTLGSKRVSVVHKNKLIVVIVFVIISFFIFRHCVKTGVSMLETISSSILYPLLRAQYAIIVPIVQWFEDRTTVYELKDNIIQLQKLNEELYAENIALKSLQVYASETSELRNFNKRYELHKGHVAQVLARHFSTTEQFFLVDAGSSQGIKKDMVVLYGNTIIGKVAQVYPWYCKVCSVTDADCKVACTAASLSREASEGLRKAVTGTLTKKGVPAEVLTKAGASGIHEGINDSTKTVVRYVSHLESVNVDDIVLSSGEGLVFPKGFALGKIIEADKGELFYTITVQPILDLQTLRYCTLIAKEDIE